MNAFSRFFVLNAFACTALLSATGSFANDRAATIDYGDRHRAAKSAPLVEKVRAATRRYKDINVAIADGWVQGTPCVSGPNEGAMGIHYVKPDRIGDGEVDASAPEALIYEPQSNGRLRLVGVEFIVLTADWDAQHPETPPTLHGHLMNLVPAPNRYRLPAFYELHVWAWENNPKGYFADWNTLVTCNQQPTS